MCKSELDGLDELYINKGVRKPKIMYKLGQKIGNFGVKFFGQEQIDERGDRTAMCVCPKCGESWRAKLKNIVSDRTKSCGCKSS